MHSLDHPKTRIRMFIAALFIKAWNWKQSKRPSTADWIDDCRIFLHSGILCSNEEWFITTCLNLTNTRLSGRGQTPKMESIWFHLHKAREQAKLFYDDRDLSCGYPDGGGNEGPWGALEMLVGFLPSFGCCLHKSVCFMKIPHWAVPLCLEHFLLISYASVKRKKNYQGICIDVSIFRDVVWWGREPSQIWSFVSVSVSSPG